MFEKSGKHCFESYLEDLTEDSRRETGSTNVWNYCNPEEQEIFMGHLFCGSET